ncbi:MAG: methyltransferase domain-containing protein [Aestuariivirga sp.]
MNIVDMFEFYSSSLGKATARIISRTLNLKSLTSDASIVLGLGYALPWLQGEQAYAFMLAKQGVLQWPQGTIHTRSVLVHDDSLPLADHSVDAALVVHGLEFADEPQAMLEEIWRVLAPQGTLHLIVTNRRGLWAISDATPFGHGQPFSRSQILKLLREAEFSVNRVSPILHMPPLARLAGWKIPELFERAGTALPFHLSGAILVEAQKQVHAFAVHKRIRTRLPIFRPVFLPTHKQPSSVSK